MPAPLICLITPGHLSSTPRVLKEADALVAAGYRVHVVAGRHFIPVDPLDEGVLAGARWASTRVDAQTGAGVLLRKVQRKVSRLLLARTGFATARLAATALHAETLHLAAVAAGVKADFYLGHCLAGLAAAALAARARGVPYGFDVEDFHDAETESASADPVEARAIQRLQRTYLPGCRHLTAASPLIARAVAERYGVAPPAVLLNVFPRAHAPAAPVIPPAISGDRPAQFYWFSQTIGAGRGLESVLAVMGRMRTPVELHLRGFPVAGYVDTLQAIAARAGVKRPIRFLASGPAAEMARLAASADLGLSTEASSPLNRDLCLTNKIFVYLLAGLPQLLSATSAQRALAPELGAAGLLADLSDPDGTARMLDAYFADPAAMRTARQHAWQLAQERYCWDVEGEKFLSLIRRALP